MNVCSFKMPFQSHLFNLNQRVYVIYHTGSLAAYCYGRHRGKNRWIRAWVNWERNKPISKEQGFDLPEDCHIARACRGLE